MRRLDARICLLLISLVFPLSKSAAEDTLLDREGAKKFCEVGESHGVQGRHQEAIVAFGKSLELCPHAKTYLARARAWQEMQNFSRAIEDLDQAVRIDPDLAIAYCWRGACRVETNDINRALADFTIAISLAPNKASIYAARASVWGSLDKHELAISDLSKAIELSSDTAALYMARGLFWGSLNNWSESLKDIDKALEIEPNHVKCYVLRGDAKKELGQYSSALEDYEHSVLLDRNSSIGNRTLALFLSTCPDESYRDYAKAVKLSHNLCEITKWKDYHAVGLLAMIHAASGNSTEAEKWQAKAIQIAPNERKEWVRQKFEKYQAKRSTITR